MAQIIDREVIEATLLALGDQKENALGQLNATNGAIQQCERFLALLNSGPPKEADREVPNGTR